MMPSTIADHRPPTAEKERGEEDGGWRMEDGASVVDSRSFASLSPFRPTSFLRLYSSHRSGERHRLDRMRSRTESSYLGSRSYSFRNRISCSNSSVSTSSCSIDISA